MVLFSHKHRFIFLKTKKTASTSVEMFFEPFCLPEGMAPGAEYRDEYIGPTGIVGSRRGRELREKAKWPQHLRASSVLRRAGLLTFARYFKFVTVRNPYTRTLAAFRYTYFRSPERIANMPFDEHFEKFNSWLDANYVQKQDRRMYLIAGIPVANAYNRYENMREDIMAVCDRLGLPCDLERLPHTKKMPPPERHYLDYYSAENRARIAKTYAWEIRKFGYAPHDPPVYDTVQEAGR